jgi:hypothetical protein
MKQNYQKNNETRIIINKITLITMKKIDFIFKNAT